MNKLLVAVFDTETDAFEGLNALKGLHTAGDISVFATAVIAKGADGVVEMKQAADKGPVGSAVGLVSGSIIGILGGPIGVALGASLGGLTGMLFDLNKTGVDLEFVKEVSDALDPGRVAVVADVEESWTTPVDARMAEHNGLVFRRLRSEVVEDQLAREAAAYDAEIEALEAELAEAGEEAKAKIEDQIGALKEKATILERKTNEFLESTRAEAEAKLATLQGQLKEASDRQSAKIEKRVAAVRADLESRSAKLSEAAATARSALS